MTGVSPTDPWGLPPLHYDRQGRPITIEEAGPLHLDRDYTVVASHQEGEYRVSTVWLGTDIGRATSREGQLFESMVFGPGMPDRSWRYPDEAAAVEGHERLVAKLRDYLNDPTKGFS